jgi:hypothetical protein
MSDDLKPLIQKLADITAMLAAETKRLVEDQQSRIRNSDSFALAHHSERVDAIQEAISQLRTIADTPIHKTDQ